VKIETQRWLRPIYGPKPPKSLDELGSDVLDACELDISWQLADQGRTVIGIDWSIDDVMEGHFPYLGEDGDAPTVLIAVVAHIRKVAV